ncbi:MAG TPA: flagellar basal body rod protein FlgC [Desulfobacterales bacterium]|nr:flagellar basal body rod protein FlgC [Desulfobacterales bacterium]
MDFMRALHVSGTGLNAHRTKMNVIAENLANSETTRTEEGGPYRRKMVVFEAKPVENFESVLESLEHGRNGVEVTEVITSQEDYRLVHNPSHPDADPVTGYVAMPNVNLLTEIADMMVARRAYDASVTAISNTKSMILKALEIGK